MGHLVRIVACTLCIVTISHCALFSNLWAVHIEGGEKKAQTIAERNGFTYLGKIITDHYHFRHHHVARRSTSTNKDLHTALELDPEVLWLQQQEIKVRVKRDRATFNDREFRHQWYLWDGGMHRSTALSMNVQSAWRMGYTGRGVVVTILDDGIEHIHPDLSANYDQQASWDINGGDSDPTPRYDFTNENRHGTRCAGEVAAVANNSNCGVGVAYEASIGGIRMLDGDVTDSVEAASLSLNRDHIDIYSASWGPDDDGKTVDGPALLARRAFREGVQQGRGGKGSIFVWASGNGGRDSDNCNCDGYTNSIYTLSVSSATENGNVPWYSEACSSTLVSTFSSGDHKEKQITTTDLRRGCTGTHTGTSASAPLAAGIVALALHANPDLTWRDVQYIATLAASSNGLEAPDWVTNGAGRKVSHHFGFGMMDALKMVQLAANWTRLPEQHICEVASPSRNIVVLPEQAVRIVVPTLGCQGSSNQHVKYVEHVQAKISLTSTRRGDLQIWLTSPSGTKSTLLTRRVNDNSHMGFNEWAFLTTHNWGEEAEGEWILEISNSYGAAKPAVLRYWTLILYGTATYPLKPSSLNITSTPESIKNSHVQAGSVPPDSPTSEDSTTAGPSLSVLTERTTPKHTVHHTPVSSVNKNISRVHSNTNHLKTDLPVNQSPGFRQDFGESDQRPSRCPNNTFYLKNQCLSKCPDGYYEDAVRNRGLLCQPCHSSCAACVRAHNSSCTECYYGFQLVQGQCIMTADASTGNRKTGASAKSHGLSPTALKSVIFGATTTLVVLVLILVTLVVYYVYHQYESQHKPQNSKSRTPKDIVYSPAACEQLNGSEHSSQQELMDSDEEASSQGKTSLISTAGYQYKPAECSTETV